MVGGTDSSSTSPPNRLQISATLQRRLLGELDMVEERILSPQFAREPDLRRVP